MVLRSMPSFWAAGHHSAKTKNLLGTAQPCKHPHCNDRRLTTIPLVDRLINELKNRFGIGAEETAVQCLFGVRSMLLAWKETWMTSFGRFSTFHEDLFPLPLSLDAEKWQRKWERQDPKAVLTTPSATLKEIDHTMYPNITECLQIFSTLPVTTCECERNVLALRRLKTYLWSPMSKARLSGLALLHFHYNMDIDLNEIIFMFVRKMELANTCLTDSKARKGHFS